MTSELKHPMMGLQESKHRLVSFLLGRDVSPAPAFGSSELALEYTHFD